MDRVVRGEGWWKRGRTREGGGGGERRNREGGVRWIRAR